MWEVDEYNQSFDIVGYANEQGIKGKFNFSTINILSQLHTFKTKFVDAYS